MRRLNLVSAKTGSTIAWRFRYQPRPCRGPDQRHRPGLAQRQDVWGWVQGDNAQAVVTAEQIVIVAEVTVDSPDFGHLEPMVTAAGRARADRY